jgi:5,10-methylenetetrahydrofolate reductase
MKSVLEAINEKGQKPFFLCDFSPPKGGNADLLLESYDLNPDMFMVANAPGKSVRLNPIFAADWIYSKTKTPSIFTVSTRDMNKGAMQSLLLGAELMGLPNVLIVKGDKFSAEDMNLQTEVNDFTTTELVSAVKAMNERRDFRGKELTYPTRFCIGAALDLSRDWEKESHLTKSKITKGCNFIVSQPTFDPELPSKFLSFYEKTIGEKLKIPVMWGIQMVEKDTISFASVPRWVHQDLEEGGSSYEITTDLVKRYLGIGIDTFYLVPTIYKGGRRDYLSAQAVIEDIE